MEVLDAAENRKNSELAARILDLARSTVMVEFRYMQRAVSAVSFAEYDGAQGLVFACDGVRLYYDPAYVLSCYRSSRDLPARSILHSLLHFVFRHGLTGEDVDPDLWDLAADVAVETAIDRLEGSRLAAGNRNLRKAFTDLLEQDLKYVTAESVYRWLREHGIGAEEAQKQREVFRLDQHSLWKQGSARTDADTELVRVWEDISRKMQTEIETMTDDRGPLAANLRRVNRRRRSYADFLRRFARQSEVLRISEEEFDNNYYTYGMRLYGNVPLIENLEYREQRNIRSFVIAVDTSGSVQGEKVQRFVQKTYELLMSASAFDVKTEIHILQCDDRVREDARITGQKDLERYLEQMQILGLGKTDFRPVFRYVDKMMEEKKLPNMAGLLYFTDGEGIYPEKRAPYPTAFILQTEEVYPPEVPAWAMRLILEEELG